MALWMLSSKAWEGPEDGGGDGTDLDTHLQPFWPESLGPASRCPSLAFPSVKPLGIFPSHAFSDSQQLDANTGLTLSVPPQVSRVQAGHGVPHGYCE